MSYRVRSYTYFCNDKGYQDVVFDTFDCDYATYEEAKNHFDTINLEHLWELKASNLTNTNKGKLFAAKEVYEFLDDFYNDDDPNELYTNMINYEEYDYKNYKTSVD